MKIPIIKKVCQDKCCLDWKYHRCFCYVECEKGLKMSYNLFQDFITHKDKEVDA